MIPQEILLFLMLGLTLANQIKTCPENEEFRTCGTACPPTCQNRTIQICTDQCVRGCFCKKGFIRTSLGGPCVETCENVPICKKNEIYSTCATLCPKTCNQTEPQVCPLVCKVGCVCEENYVRETKEGKCIPEVSCKQQCDENEIYKECGTLCPGTCSQPVKACQRKCAKGCFCKDGYLLDHKTNKCIKKEDCSIN